MFHHMRNSKQKPSNSVLLVLGTAFLPFFLLRVKGSADVISNSASEQQQRKVAIVEIGAHRLLEHLHDRAILDYNHDVVNDRRLQASYTDGTSDDLMEICRVVQNSFSSKAVECRCMGSLHRSFSMSCEYKEDLCSESNSSVTCGQPQIAVSMVEGNIFSSTTCVKKYRRGMLPMEDTCVFVDACPHATRDGFCGCTASYGGLVCGSCEVCPGGRSISVDCSNLNAEAVTKKCQPVDLDLNLAAGSGSLAGFAPSFSGFCTELEQALNNKIACDCTDAVGGSFSLSCQTTEEVCMNDGRHCGEVKSTVEVVNGTMDTVVSCGKYSSEPFMGGETCTGIQLCSGGQGVCGCWATYNGKKCNSCEVCRGGVGLTMDCSNLHENAIVEQCQSINLTSSYEFLPNYPIASQEVVVSGSTSAAIPPASFAAGFMAAMTILISGLSTS